MWLVERQKKVQVHFTLTLESLNDQTNSNKWEIYMIYDMTLSGLLDINTKLGAVTSNQIAIHSKK